MLICDSCSVGRFCNETHQQISSKRGDQHRKAVRHKNLCPLLKKWRHVAKGKATAEACTPDLLEFLRQDPWLKLPSLPGDSGGCM